MNVLVACEQSGAVRSALRRRGHNAYSCDIQPARDGGPHLQGNVRRYLDLPWDTIIAFPPCTFLTRAAAWRWKRSGAELVAAMQLVLLLYESAPRVAIENPHGALNWLWRYPDQVVHPWWFGHPWTKPTCLWLKGLPMLTPTRRVDPTDSWMRMNSPDSNQRMYRRSKTPQGLADAMAEQWTPDLSTEATVIHSFGAGQSG